MPDKKHQLLGNFKDPYLLDFLNLPSGYLEFDLETAILKELEKFILEVGKGFAFVERQKRMIIDGEETPVGLILCAETSCEQVELLEMHKDGIMVAEYWTELPPRKDLEKRLHQAYLEAKEIIEKRKIAGLKGNLIIKKEKSESRKRNYATLVSR